MEKSIQPRGAPVYPLDTQGEFSVIAGPDGHRSVLFRLRSRNPSLEFPEPGKGQCLGHQQMQNPLPPWSGIWCAVAQELWKMPYVCGVCP